MYIATSTPLGFKIDLIVWKYAYAYTNKQLANGLK